MLSNLIPLASFYCVTNYVKENTSTILQFIEKHFTSLHSTFNNNTTLKNIITRNNNFMTNHNQLHSLGIAFVMYLCYKGISNYLRYQPVTNNTLDKKLVVVITGSSTGIGRDTAIQLALRNCVVYATVRRDEDGNRLVESFKEILKKDNITTCKGEIIPLLCDVTKEEQIEQMTKYIEGELVKEENILLGLVNNAGICYTVPGELISKERETQILNVNFLAAVNLTKQFLPLLRKYGRRNVSKILQMSSIFSLHALCTASMYAATKAALVAYSKVLHSEVNTLFGIKVISIVMGFAKTSLTHSLSNTNLHDNGLVLDDERKIAYNNYLNNTEKRSTICDLIYRAIPSSESVAKRVAVLTLAKNPRVTEPVSWDGWLFYYVLRHIPDNWVDWLLSKTFTTAMLK
ncbi:hypothetical protein ABK040_016179 [Willaertia magna]